MVLGDVATKLLLARVPLDVIISLLVFIDQPMILHVYGAGKFIFDGVINNACVGGVVTMYWSWWFRVAHSL